MQLREGRGDGSGGRPCRLEPVPEEQPDSLLRPRPLQLGEPDAQAELEVGEPPPGEREEPVEKDVRPGGLVKALQQRRLAPERDDGEGVAGASLHARDDRGEGHRRPEDRRALHRAGDVEHQRVGAPARPPLKDAQALLQLQLRRADGGLKRPFEV